MRSTPAPADRVARPAAATRSRPPRHLSNRWTRPLAGALGLTSRYLERPGGLPMSIPGAARGFGLSLRADRVAVGCSGNMGVHAWERRRPVLAASSCCDAVAGHG